MNCQRLKKRLQKHLDTTRQNGTKTDLTAYGLTRGAIILGNTLGACCDGEHFLPKALSQSFLCHVVAAESRRVADGSDRVSALCYCLFPFIFHPSVVGTLNVSNIYPDMQQSVHHYCYELTVTVSTIRVVLRVAVRVYYHSSFTSTTVTTVHIHWSGLRTSITKRYQEGEVVLKRLLKLFL